MVSMIQEIKLKDRFYIWASAKVRTPLAPLWLYLFFLTETFFFIPLDPLLMVYCLENPSKRFYYAAIATLASLTTAVIGYLLGLYLWDLLSPYILDHLISTSFFHKIEMHYEKYESLAVIIGSVLPFPFKAITLSAGACHLPFTLFIGAIAFGRALRFFSLSHLMHRFGEKLRSLMQKYMSHAALAVGVKIIVTIAVLWLLR